jgi:hypothetical protein
LLGLVLCCVRPAAVSGYCLQKFKADKPFAAWTTVPVTYQVSDTLTDPDLLGAIDAAFQAWGSVSCSKLTFVRGAPFKLCAAKPCDPGTVEFDHASPHLYLFWHTGAWGPFANPANPTLPYASTSYVWQNNIGGIVGASIAVNAKDYAFQAKIGAGCSGAIFDLKDFMMPLVGGVIGLTDSTVPGAVMYPDGSKYCSTAKSSLTPDDQGGVLYLYHQGPPCPSPPEPGPEGCTAGPPPPPPADGGGVRNDFGGQRHDAGTVVGDGAAGKVCTTSSQCGADERCSAEGVCVKTEGGGGGGGCCRISHARSDGAGGLLVLVLAVWAFWRGRRKKC